jgi:hypothetical protein
MSAVRHANLAARLSEEKQTLSRCVVVPNLASIDIWCDQIKVVLPLTFWRSTWKVHLNPL